MTRFHARGDGVVAVYDGADTDPMDHPLENLERIVFHSGLRYPKIIDQKSGSITLPARGADYAGSVAHNLGPHGRPGTPLVVGYATIGGNRIRLGGTVPIQMTDRGWLRAISIGADATHIRMAEVCFAYSGSGFASINVPWTVYILDTVF